MQSHFDSEHEQKAFLQRLKERAGRATESNLSRITAGGSGEKELASWKGSNGVHVRHLPDDEQGILRISAGGGSDLPLPMEYLVIRGSVGKCIALLEKAIVALRESPE